MWVVRDLEQGTGNACCLKQHILIAEIFIENFRGREWVFRFLTYLLMHIFSDGVIITRYVLLIVWVKGVSVSVIAAW